MMVVACIGGFALGCGDDVAPAGDFVADNPFGAGAGGETGAAGEDGGNGVDTGGDGGDPNREISEADIVHIEGDILYALSQFGGLVVVDVHDPDDLQILGRYQAHANPFEMYVQDGQVFVMYADYGRYQWDETAGGYAWRSTSNLVALDARTPTDIVATGEFEMPGRIQDSRRVGDVLYLVTHQDGYCWDCQNERNTTVTSLDVSDPTHVQRVAELRFVVDDQADSWGWNGERSVSATDQRMYIAGIEFGADWQQGHSVIDVVDISDPGGALVMGQSVPVAGQISNRWQMDEYDGVLRVVSQPGQWGSAEPPVVETFSVAAADDITPLGSVTMTLPRPEALRAVRFDGARGYAITFEQIDPLFTLDLSDPSTPLQVGELEIPGWVQYIEPRGDRLLGLGHDPGNPEGSINVSLFDVSTMSAPTMLSRVHFGGDWASFAEDQNRIHKAFTILDELELLAVPFSGWEWDASDEYRCHGHYRSAVQLIDWRDDTLVRRGQAPAHGVARRALVHRDRLLAMSDKSVESFDISDRDVPASRSEVALAANVTKVAVGEDIVVRLSQDWWSNEVLLQVASLATPDSPVPLGSLNLNAVLDGDNTVEGCWTWGLWSAELVAHGDFAYLIREQWADEAQQSLLLLDVFDLTDPAHPQFVRTQAIDVQLGWGSGAVVDVDDRRIVKVGAALVMSARDGYGYDGGAEAQSARFVVLDLTDPSAPQLRPSLARPDALAHGDLQVFGNEVVSWHMEAVNDDPARVRFFMDRLDVGDPSAPVLRPSVNVPGVVAGYDAASRRAVTVDFALETREVADDAACYQDAKIHGYDYETKRCTLAHRTLHSVQLVGDTATLLSSLDVEGPTGALRSLAVTPNHVFARVSEGSWGWWGGAVGEDGAGVDGGVDDGVPLVPSDAVALLSGWTTAPLSVTSTTQVGLGSWWLGPVRAVGNFAVLSVDTGLGVLDARDASAPALTVHDLAGYGCWDLTLVDNLALCPMGEYGLQVIRLDQ